MNFDISYYHDYISPQLAKELLKEATPVDGTDEFVQVGASGGLESPASLKYLRNLYLEIKEDLKKVLQQRIKDRKFIDERVRAYSKYNSEQNKEIDHADYRTIIGLEDENNRIVLGPLNDHYVSSGGDQIAPIPDFLKGPHVTLFGPPDSAKMAINAMNSYHRKLPSEPPIVAELLKKQTYTPKWGADDEDSKTPLRKDLMDAAVNLTNCFNGSIRVPDNDKYKLAQNNLALPIKRFPGLALPSTFLFFRSNPMPLHLYDFALHLFKNWQNPEALVFYVPKLENEEEAAYIHKMVATAESLIKKEFSAYKLGSVRLMIVLENPRAILRTHEIMNALHPYFVGASLGWHDYLGSTARVFKEDSHYRIPVKADPDIVIKYIKASHLLLAEVVGSRGGIKVGGMYGILPQDNELHSPSFQMTMLGFIKDVVTQMKRDLTGYWVAHPDFVRLGIALVEAWRLRAKSQDPSLEILVKELLVTEHHQEIMDFINGDDIEGLAENDPNYVRSLIVADIKESDFVANNAPEEIRYNVFQSLQYITDWLSGNGCVALPAIVKGVPVRVMDDLATAERSRWEVWHEIYHGRFSLEEFVKIVHEEMLFIRKDFSNDEKIVQVKWTEQSAKWYPIATRIMLQLMTDSKPVEFATELLMPFTIEKIRNAKDPWAVIQTMDPGKFKLPIHVEKLHNYYEICGCARFASEMAKNAVIDFTAVKNCILSFSRDEVNEAATFHGDIGESKKGLDILAANEQKLVIESQAELLNLGQQYRDKFGFKFLVSAKGKDGQVLLKLLKQRLNNSLEVELQGAKEALWQITEGRLKQQEPLFTDALEQLQNKHNINKFSLAINLNGYTQTLAGPDETYQIASLSKTLAAAFSLEYCKSKNISLETSIDELFGKSPSKFRLGESSVQLQHLLNHCALNMHYVKGFANDQPLPAVEKLLAEVKVINPPGQKFSYSGGGFLVLEHLIESLEGQSIEELTEKFFKNLHLSRLSFKEQVADDGQHKFPRFAAGGLGTSKDMAEFLKVLDEAYNNINGCQNISHDTAVQMLHGQDRGAMEFMGTLAGLGVFIGEAGDNKFAIHQGANEGFRNLYLHCFYGPDRGKGFVVFAKGDDEAVPFVAEVAQELIKELKFQHINLEQFNKSMAIEAAIPEERVNQGYKAKIFSAFRPCLPERIVHRGKKDSLSSFNLLTKSKILKVSDQRFARAENLINSHWPTFDPYLFGRQGKIMDSWESSRHNESEFHNLELELEEPSEINFASISTQFHDGNHIEAIEILAGDSSHNRQIILPKTKLEGHSLLKVALEASETKYKYIQVKAYPDGGLTRLGLYSKLPENELAQFLPIEKAKAIKFTDKIPECKKPMSIPFNKKAQPYNVTKASNEQYGPAEQVASPFSPLHMFDGFESARNRDPDHVEELNLKLKSAKKIERVVLDFKYFINNNPKYVRLMGKKGKEWHELVGKTNVKAFAGNQKELFISSPDKFQDLKVCCYPDGGINRIYIN